MNTVHARNATKETRAVPLYPDEKKIYIMTYYKILIRKYSLTLLETKNHENVVKTKWRRKRINKSIKIDKEINFIIKLFPLKHCGYIQHQATFYGLGTTAFSPSKH